MRLAALVALPVLAAPAIAGDLDAFLGHWQTIGHENPGPAIEAAVRTMPFLERGWAKQRLANVNPLYQDIAFAMEGGKLSQKLDDRKALLLDLTGPTTWVREDNEPFQVTVTVSAGKLIQTIKGRDGQRVNTFRVSQDGKTLKLEVKVTSHKLSAPVLYEMLFQKA
jgi:hypothetical protein